jgi:hypothetical protein
MVCICINLKIKLELPFQFQYFAAVQFYGIKIVKWFKKLALANPE